MTSPISNCEMFAHRLADFLEQDVDETTRASMEAHARFCDECGPLLADLRSLRIEAANLPALAPSRDLWAGIAERIEAPVVNLARGAAGAGSGSRWTRGTADGWKHRRIAPIWFGLAAAGLVAVTATVTHEMTKRSLTPASTVAAVAKPASMVDTTTKTAANMPVMAPSPAATQVAASNDSLPPFRPSTLPPASSTHLASMSTARPTAQQTYDSEIARLRVVVNERRGQLDSTTVATIEKNLVIIDVAISQCKQALRKDPASRFLMESLNDAMDTKVQLLRTAASLPAGM